MEANKQIFLHQKVGQKYNNSYEYKRARFLTMDLIQGMNSIYIKNQGQYMDMPIGGGKVIMVDKDPIEYHKMISAQYDLLNKK